MTKRAYLIIIGVLVLILAAIVYKFVVVGTTAPGDDGRTAVMLAPAERALVLREMRGFVAGLQAMTDGLARNDMKAVATASRTMGMSRSHDAPVALLGKLPLEFKSLAFSLHRDFDTIALDAETMAMPAHTLDQLATALQKCVACHELYQVRSTR